MDILSSLIAFPAAAKKRQRNDVDDLDAMNIDDDVLTQAADKLNEAVSR
jgi:hypothetical protein